MGWLKNFPVPEYQLGLLLVGLVLHFWAADSTTFVTNIGYVIFGGALIAGSVVLSVWAATSFGQEAMAKPETLRTSGPYRFTRNPMYLSWLLVTLGLGLLLGSWWLIAASLIAGTITQFRVISGEEKFLTEQFGEEYETFCNRTPRWLWPL
ncbi:MAG: isoprenylcysteine carboxylmethyltransferase family protein [Chloroflexi bacterium]|jgi:protein-S-isoprenylcysteine O-methyltransferase Ste14|nr:isoprenylcysteine carboxylmethyltransferase family protein [Chloroflexota bacterium]MBT5627885.1 isoprenylcysteine carboxylmethyltransferase family protein [Chloroflexota bacterium]